MQDKNQIQVRACQCIRCGHLWVARVILSSNTTNLSGEATKWCPSCGSKAGYCGPIQVLKFEENHENNLRTMRKNTY